MITLATSLRRIEAAERRVADAQRRLRAVKAADPRLQTSLLPGEPKKCGCGARTWVMLLHWQGDDPEAVVRSIMCDATNYRIEGCPNRKSAP